MSRPKLFRKRPPLPPDIPLCACGAPGRFRKDTSAWCRTHAPEAFFPASAPLPGRSRPYWPGNGTDGAKAMMLDVKRRITAVQEE